MYKNFKNNKYKKGGNLLNLSGPNVIGYFSNQSGKKIILIGEMHGDKSGSCTDLPNQSIDQYIKNFKSEYPIDIFVETDIPSKKILVEQNPEYIQMIKNLIPKNVGYINEIIDLAYTNYKKNDKKRYHFVDVRYSIKGQEDFASFDKIFRYLIEGKIRIGYPDFENLFGDFINTYVFSLFNIIRFITNPDFNSETNELSIPEFFYKEFKRLYDTDKDSLDKIVLILKNYLKDFLDMYFKTQPESKNIIWVKEIYTAGQIAGAAITDFYTVSRIMKSNEFNNCIIYGGRAHYDTMRTYLNALGFRLEHEFFSDEDNFRCVQNVIDFNDFFQI